MKKLFYLLLAFGLVSGADAKTIMPSEAEGIAAGFMAGRTFGVPRMKKAPGAAADNRAALPYYIYNCEDGGFVIVSGDDRFGEILAYSYAGSIDMTAAPDGLTGLLGLYLAAFEALPADDADAGSVMEGMPSVVVAPLLGDIAWGQDAPFNALTPVASGNTRFYTGCVACAATQIMRYHTYPAKGTGSKTYTDPMSKNTLTADFGNTEYLWELMPAAVPQTVSAQQTEAYSTLAAQFGVAVEMQYEASGSGTYDMLVPYALRNYFGYDAGVRVHLRDYYSTSEWMSLIKSELEQGRPVFYGGSSDRGPGGHAFVLDGYDSLDFVHVNWGWYGSSNGYFRINHLDPSSLGEGGGAGGYNLSQDMVTGIRPAVDGSTRDHAIYGESRLSIDGPFGNTYTMMCYAGNIDVEPFSGRIEGALVKDGEVVATLGGDALSLDGFKNGHSGSAFVSLSNVASTVDGVADGDDYDMCLVYKATDGDRWTVLRHPSGLPSRNRASVKDGNIILGEKHLPYPDVVLHSAIETDGDLYAGGYGRVAFLMESLTGDYNISSITMRLTSLDDPSVVFDANVSVSIYNQSVESVDVTFPVSADVPAGRYRLDALVKANDTEYPFALNGFAPAEVNVCPVPDGPVVRLVGTPAWQVNSSSENAPEGPTQGEYLYVTGVFRNAGVAGNAKILARLTNTDTGLVSPFVMSETAFSSDKAVSVAFARQLPHDPGTYTLDFVQVNDDNSHTPMVSLDEPLSITIAPSDNIVADVTAFDFPDRIAKTDRVNFTLEATARQTVSTTLYIRVRQLTNTKGEIVTLKSGVRFVAGEPLTVSGTYRPGSSLEDGIYMVIVETGSSSKSTPLGNHALYANTVAIGEVSGIDAIEAAETSAAIWLEGKQLRVVPADGQTVSTVEICTIAGQTIARDRYDLSYMPSGIYIVSATLSNGARAVAKIALK